MKKFLLAATVVLAAAFSPTMIANADQPVLSYPPQSENVNVKATICHWANGNLSEPSVDLSAVADVQTTGHGLLTLTATGSLASFLPHEDPPGHEQDAIIDIYLKHGNDVVFLYQANTLCNPAETTTTTQASTTTTTAVEVTTTTVPERPLTLGTPDVVVTEAPVALVAPRALTQPAPVSELPRTGSGIALLALGGLGSVITGLGLRRLFKKN